MTPDRAEEIASRIRADYALTRGAAEAIKEIILQACAEQREEDARLMEIMSGQISELTEQFDSSRAEGAFNALVNGAAAIRGQT
jgi:hypothetical protein